MDTIKIKLQNNDGYLETCLEINNSVVNHFTNPFSFLFYWKESTDLNKNNHCGFTTQYYSDFEPFTCSCGISGCAGIWNGILVKWRKNTVEWRLPKRIKHGYNFLDKSFYSFDREEYEQVAKDVMSFSWDHLDVRVNDHTTIYEKLDWLFDYNENVFKET